MAGIFYSVAAVCFIVGLKMLSRPERARLGNALSAFGMLLAIVVTLLDQDVLNPTLVIIGVILGGAIGAIAAFRVAMTAMPEMVALLNGFGGGASLLVANAELIRSEEIGSGLALTAFLAIAIGGVALTGSGVAYLKLAEKLPGRPIALPGGKVLNIGLIAITLLAGVAFVVWPSVWWLPLILILVLVLGIAGVLPIGGGDMPVIIALLNSLSGLAAAATGFVLENSMLVVAGCLVGASGLILTIIMCKAMNRSLLNVVAGGFGGTPSGGEAVEGEMRAASVNDAFYVLEAAESIVIIPGYGMAVAQAQHAVKDLMNLLEKDGREVKFAIHPVAGRMPGHMNVLLAEADVPYEKLCEMDEMNAIMSTVDVALVIGANDVVNPAALEDSSSPIYGMPIIRADQARSVFALKRGQGRGFSGLENRLFYRPNVRMLYGDAKATLTALAGEFKSSN
ncbi:MAG: NAD(P)(+) transhydrogenase (Re/Si-specific) subunit beta [Verrucomicrobiales bacterium]